LQVKRSPPKAKAKEEEAPQAGRRGVRVDVEEAMRAARKRLLLSKGSGAAEVFKAHRLLYVRRIDFCVSGS